MSSINDIYGRSISFGGAFSADSALLSFNITGDGGGVSEVGDMLVTQAQWQYPQNIKIFRSLSSKDAYIHAGPAGEQPGQLMIGQIIGPHGLNTVFAEQFGAVCNVENNSLTLSMEAGCGDETQEGWDDIETITFHYCVISNFGGQASVEDFLFRQNVQLMFYALSVG
jgi:hypothetical protein